MTLPLFDLTGKVAFVTGGGRGLGQAMALGLAAAGAKVAVAARSEDEVAGTVKAIRATGGEAVQVIFDATVQEDSERLVAETLSAFGRLDIAVVNHGIGLSEPAEETSAETWLRTIEVNLTGAFYCCQAAGCRMITQGEGGSVIVTSSTGSLVGFEGLTAYGASKGGVDQMVRQLALEWGPHAIRVNAINPGYTDNPMRGSKGGGLIDPLEDQIRSMTPMQRRGAVREFVGPVIFLASEAASFVTGVTLPVDGGYCAK